MRRFCECMAVTRRTRVLDVGGDPGIWRIAEDHGCELPDILFVNVVLPPQSVDRQWVVADGCRLPFADGEFDCVFCNSVIEHVAPGLRREAFAREIQRVGRGYFVQSPDRCFPFEPHLLLPFVHWLPAEARKRIDLRGGLAGMTQKSHGGSKRSACDVDLLRLADMKALFPGARAEREYFLGWPKSLIAWKAPR